MITKTVGFGRLWRYECDSGVPGKCEERFTVLAGEVPEGWSEEDSQEHVYCDMHVSEKEIGK